MLKKLWDEKFRKFILVGIINTLFGYAIMFVFYNLFGLSYWISSASNYIFGSILSYFLNKYYTFQNKERSIKIVIKFIINITICYVIAYGVAKPVTGYILSDFGRQIQENAAMLVGMGLFVILNYIGQRLIVFSEKNEISEEKI